MTELDLGLKVGIRKLFWSMGYSTRLDVELRGFRPPADASVRGRAQQSWTDLDVLGVSVVGGHRLSTEIADCKTSRKDSTSRMFWVRGAADLFGADHAYLVREHEVTDAARQLSARLGITVLTSPDLKRLQEQYDAPMVESSGPLSILFDRPAVEAHLAAFNGLDGRLRNLLDYRDFDYWVYEPHRNPMQMIAHLTGARRHLDPKNPIHVALLLDLSWLYLRTLIQVVAHIRGAFLGHPDRGLQEYMFGGAINLQEKEQMLELLKTFAPKEDRDGPALSHLPAYYGHMREIVTRLLRRPAQMQNALRYAEAATALAAAKKRVAIKDGFPGGSFDPIAAKLVADVCGFMVMASELDPGFRLRARAYLLAEDPQLDADGNVVNSQSRTAQLSLDADCPAPRDR